LNILDAILVLQMTVAWAGDFALPRLIGGVLIIDELGGGDLFQRLFPRRTVGISGSSA